MGKKIVQDVAEVLVTNIDTGKIVMMGEAQVTGISQSINEEKIKGGIGNKTVFLLRSDKEIELAITSATYDSEFFAMTQGVDINPAGALAVTRTVILPIVDNAGTLEATIPDAPTALTTAIIVNKDETQEEAAVTTGVISIPTGDFVEGDKVTVYYREELVGRTVELDSTKFSSKFRVEYRTIAYDVASAVVDSDIYYVFDECLPSGAFDMSLTAGGVYTPEISFTVTNPIGSNKMGTYMEVPRNGTP